MQILWVVVLAAVINALLLIAAARFANVPTGYRRIILGAVVGAVLTGVSLLPDAVFFETMLWQILVLLAAALTAYGIRKDAAAQVVLYVLLQLSLGGVSTAQGHARSALLGAAGMCLACLAVGSKGVRVPVEIVGDSGTLHLTALRDTGNTLVDPVTGHSVLVVDVQTAKTLTGLTEQQLRDPVQTMHAVSGLRLIPCSTVSGSGFLLARRFAQVRVGKWQGSALVAFSAQQFGSNYQALTGGWL